MNIPRTKGAAIVTGAAQGIGQAIAIRLAKDGYDVAVNDIPEKEDAIQAVVKGIIELTGRKSISVAGDVSHEESVIEMVKKTVDQLGILRVMVANAGIAHTFNTEFMDLRLEDFEKVLKVNLIGTFLCYREAARQMVQQGTWGRIIGASSFLGKRGAPRSTGYAASKFGNIGITQCLASEMKIHGITVNAYAPGLIETPMSGTASLNPELSDQERKDKLPELVFTVTRMNLPLGQTEDVANVVSFLASEESKFMTGQTLSIDGGIYFNSLCAVTSSDDGEQGPAATGTAVMCPKANQVPEDEREQTGSKMKTE